MEDELKKIDGVAEVSPSLVDTVGFEEKNLVAVLVNGWIPGSSLFRGVRIIDGRAIQEGDQNAVMLGRVVALTLEKKAGDPLTIAGVPFHVVGIFESDSWFENGGMVMPLQTLQQMMGKEGQVTGFLIRATSSDSKFITDLRKRIESKLSGIAATPARDHVESDTQIRLAKAMAWTTAAVALILGSVGMLNTMLMSIFERTREIGILRAVGWRRRRVLELVLGEALVIALMGSVLGMILAVAGLRAITMAPTARGFINPNLPPEVLLIALAMGVGLSLLGGLYPAVRAASLEPTEALRYE
jgi:putative ABC transport system permease protein